MRLWVRLQDTSEGTCVRQTQWFLDGRETTHVVGLNEVRRAIEYGKAQTEVVQNNTEREYIVVYSSADLIWKEKGNSSE